MTEKPRETQAESHVVELKEKVNNSSLMKHREPIFSKRMGWWLIERIASRTAVRSAAHSLMVELTNTWRRSTVSEVTTKHSIAPEYRPLL